MHNIINEYLVNLGWQVDLPGQTRFNDALRLATREVEKFTGGMTKGFLVAGAEATAALTSISGAAIGLMSHVADSDLQFQVYARRMFLTTDAARGLKLATDALGYSIEDIIFGPPELRERYSKLIADEQKMFAMFGGSDFEAQMRKIRDIRFEFTRMGLEAKVFSMVLTKDLSKALFGEEDGLQKKLQRINDWFIENLPNISQKVTTYLVPVLKDTWKILSDIGDISRVAFSGFEKLLGDLYDDPRLKSGKVSIDAIGIALDHVSDSIRKVFDWLDKVAQTIDKHPYLARMFGGAAAGAAAGSIIPGVGTVAGGLLGAGGGLADQAINDLQQSEGYKELLWGKRQWQQYAAQAASRNKVDPALLMGLIDKESSFNPYAYNKDSGAYGFGQFMPGNTRMYGENAYNPFQNMDMTAHYLSDLLRKHNGNVGAALKEYGGFVTKDPSGYIGDILKRRDTYKESIGGGALKPMSYGGGSRTYNLGGIHVNHPNASADEIASVVVRRVRELDDWQAQLDMANSPTVFA